MSAAPRQWILRGHHALRGFVASAEPAGVAEARRRLLAAWTPGSEVWAVGEAEWLLLWPESRAGRAEALPGAAVIERDEAYVACLLDDRSWAALGLVPSGALVCARGGAVEVLPLRTRVDPSAWIELDGLVELDARTLGAPPRAIAPPPALAPVSVRERLLPAALAQPDPGAAAVRAAMLGLRPPSAPPGGSRRRVGSVRPNWRDRARQIWRGLGDWLTPPPAPVAEQPGRVTVEARTSVAKPAAVWSALRRLLDRWALAARWTRRLGAKNAAYIQQMMSKFEGGDLMEALRYAIPLGSGQGDVASTPSGAVGPRSSLAISAAGAGARGALFTSDDLFEHLRRMYRAALARLEREGKIEEAAFVLAELLGQSEEAVALLERHQRHRLAAELAEARDLDPSLVVRQWAIAGEIDRAVLLARRHGVFAAAIQRLERTHPDHACTLRLLWAEAAAEAGDFVRAVDIAWPLADARRLAMRWIDAALEGTDDGAARMVARKAALEPESLQELLPRVLALAADLEPSRARIRQVMARALMAEGAPAARVLAKPLARALVRDVGAGLCGWSARELSSLAQHTEDRALVADLPRMSARAVRDDEGAPLVDVRIDARDVGPTPLFDAVLLPKRQLLVACGEGGVRWATSDGRRIAHFDVPAERLVISDHGDRALALAQRGTLCMVSKIDLRARAARSWLDLEIVGFADSFDGGSWYVLEKDAVVAVDLLTRRATALWRVSTDGIPYAIARSPEHLAFAVRSAASDDVWRYALPASTLRSRQVVAGEVDGEPRRVVAVGAQGHAVVSPGGLTVVLSGHGERRVPHDPELAPRMVAIGPDGDSAWMRVGTDGVSVGLARGRVGAGHIALGGSSEARVRIQDRSAVVIDRAGRLLVEPLTRAGWRADLRL